MNQLARLGVGQKWALLFLAAAAVVGLAYLTVLSDKWMEIDDLAAKETPMKQEFEEKLQKAKNLEVYKRQLVDIEQRFSASLKQLPSKTEMEGLLSDVNQAGVGRGLAFELFRPADVENMTEVYAELPVGIRVTGDYGDFGQFAADVAKLPRIVTLNDVKIQHNAQAQAEAKEGGKKLTMEVVAKIYRYLDDQERQQQLQAQKELQRKRRPPPTPREDADQGDKK